MGRYRPPAPASSPYITPSGYQQIRKELQDIWRFRREVTEAVRVAAAEGDRSENAEYIYRKKQLREIDRRVRYLQKRIPSLKVVDRVSNTDQIFFGASVSLLVGDGDECIYRIVGADEVEPGNGTISIDSPVARALIKMRVGECCDVQIGEQTLRYEVLEITYPTE